MVAFNTHFPNRGTSLKNLILHENNQICYGQNRKRYQIKDYKNISSPIFAGKIIGLIY